MHTDLSRIPQYIYSTMLTLAVSMQVKPLVPAVWVKLKKHAFFQPSSVRERLCRSCKANLFRLDKFENSVHLLYGKRRTDNSVKD